MAETYTYDNSPDSEVLTEEEQHSLEVGQQLRAEQDNLLAGKYKDAQELESAYLELQKKLGEGSDEEPAVDEADEEEVETSPAVDMITAASQELAQGGKLTQETRDALAELDSSELLDA